MNSSMATATRRPVGSASSSARVRQSITPFVFQKLSARMDTRTSRGSPRASAGTSNSTTDFLAVSLTGEPKMTSSEPTPVQSTLQGSQSVTWRLLRT
jgi:hypothetical protein